VKEWSTSESSFPIQNFSKQAVAMEGVKPLHYRQVVGNESVEEGFTSPLPQTHMETQKTRYEQAHVHYLSKWVVTVIIHLNKMSSYECM
jgi:hypothetical protein